jgi:hypothetical protein
MEQDKLLNEVFVSYKNMTLSVFEQTEGLMRANPVLKTFLPVVDANKKMTMQMLDTYEETTKKLLHTLAV